MSRASARRIHRAAGSLQSHERQEAGRVRHRDHAAIDRFLPLVPGHRAQGGAGRLLAGQGLHGDPPVRLCHLGAHPAAARRSLQGDRPRQRLLPALHSRKPADARGPARRGLCAAGGLGHQGRHRGARGDAGRPPDLGDDLRRDVPEVDSVVARPAGAHQPVGQRRPLGKSDAAVPAHHGISLAGRAHRARDRRRRRRKRRSRFSISTPSSPRTCSRCPS